MSEEMEAGRALDALVAEKVMKLPGAAIGGWSDPRHLPDGRVLPGLEPLPYSTSISAAWLVVEKLIGRGFFPEIHYMTDGDWRCEIRGSDANPVDAWVDAPTAPLSICRAAIEAHATSHESEVKTQPSPPSSPEGQK